MFKMILFDLDGTLLPMDQDVFAAEYMKGLAAAAAPYGYEPKEFIKAVAAGTVSMVRNDGARTNEAVFWDVLRGIYGEKINTHPHIFDEFYRTDFQKICKVCGYSPLAADVIRQARDSGFRVALATNPLFPSIATESRIRWAGLKPEDFELFTSFETSHFTKPNPDYYREICEELLVSLEECIMVGNDVSEDMVAEQLGMGVFLLTDCIINKDNRDISSYPHGSFDELISFIRGL